MHVTGEGVPLEGYLIKVAPGDDNSVSVADVRSEIDQIVPERVLDSPQLIDVRGSVRQEVKDHEVPVSPHRGEHCQLRDRVVILTCVCIRGIAQDHDECSLASIQCARQDVSILAFSNLGSFND